MKTKKQTTNQFMRCRVADIRTGNFPDKENAYLISTCGDCARVLIDNEEQTRTYGWMWIKFSKDH